MATKPTFRLECQFGVVAFFVNTNFVNTSFFGGSGWIDVMPDVVGGFTLHYGINGNSPADRTASAGSLTFTLNNDNTNSVNTQGYYSPFSPVKRTGFNFNIPVRLAIVFGGVTTYKFFGSLADIVPVVQEFHVTQCTALDIFDDLARIEEPELPVQLNKRGDEILNTMFDAMTTQPEHRNFEVGEETWAIALDGGTGQKLKVRERINQINLSEFGYCYPIGDLVGGGTVKWESRHHRAANPIVKFTLTDYDVLLGSFSVQGSRDNFYRHVVVTVFPTNDLSEAPVEVLFALQTTETQLLPGEVNDSIFGPYRGITSSDLIGGFDTVDPVPHVDYEMNTLSNGTGADVTDEFVVTSSRTASGVRFTITNVGNNPGGGQIGGNTGFVTKLQQRGKGIRRYEVLLDSQIAGSFGDQVLDIAMPFQNDVNVGKDVADYLAQTLSLSYANMPPVRFLASRDDVRQTAAYTLEPGDRIALTETVIGLSAMEYTINSVGLEVTADGLVWCTWELEPASTQRFWMMGVAGSGEIGVATVFGF